jgi:hypothetical protein
MQDKIITTFCILDDLLKILHHRDDPQAKAPDSESLTIAIVACQEFAGNMRKALQWVKALRLFSFVPSESRFNRRLHRLMPLLHYYTMSCVQSELRFFRKLNSCCSSFSVILGNPSRLR